MNPADEQAQPSSAPGTPHQGVSSPRTTLCPLDLDDIDDDDDADDDCFDSLDEIQQILQTFGTNPIGNDASLTIDYFDSRRFEIMYEIMNIERQFDQLKNILYDESVALIDRKLASIQSEEAPEYLDELKKLNDEMQLRLEIAKQRRTIELQALENSSHSELLSLQQTLENDKFLLYNDMRDEIERKIEELETLKMKTHLCANILQEMFPQQHQQLVSPTKRRLDTFDSSFKSTGKETKKRRVNMTNGNNGTMKPVDRDGLAVFYQLSDMDIIEDWALIQTSLQPSASSPSSSILDSNGDDSTDDNDEMEDDNDTSRLPFISNAVPCLKQEQYDYDENRV